MSEAKQARLFEEDGKPSPVLTGLPAPANGGYGQDERSLLKLPFTTLGKRSRKNRPTTLRAEWTGRTRAGREKKLYKEVVATEKYGLPQYAAEEVYVALLSYSTHQEMESRAIEVVKSDMLALMGWPRDGANYKRLARSLHQLASIYLSTNALWNNESGRYDEVHFGIIDDWAVKKGAGPKRKGGNADLLTVQWNEKIFEFLCSGARFKMLDIDAYYSLSSPVAKRLYRWADEALYPNGFFQIDLRHLAHNRLEVSRNRHYKSKIMESLRPGLDELSECGVFTWELAESQTNSGYKLVFRSIPEEVEKRKRKEKAGFENYFNALPKQERERLLSVALSKVDNYNRARFRKEGREAMGTWSVIKEKLREIIEKEERRRKRGDAVA